MKNISKILLFILLFNAITFSYISTSHSNPPIEEVTEFDAMGFETLLDGKWYVGILLSEDEYKNYTQLKIDYNSIFEKNKILSEYQLKIDLLFAENKQNQLSIISDLKDIRKDINDISFWDEYKFEFGLGMGVVLTVLTVFLVNEVSK
jgi:hypothetical protein